ncbi:hypothetical protein ACET8G_20035 [Aeromonas veronii]
MALHLFSPKGALHELTSSNLNALRRDDFLGTLQVAAKNNLLGFQFLVADHLLDAVAISELLVHVEYATGNADADRMELAILLCRPLLERLDRLVSSPHPHYDKERRRGDGEG